MAFGPRALPRAVAGSVGEQHARSDPVVPVVELVEVGVEDEEVVAELERQPAPHLVLEGNAGVEEVIDAVGGVHPQQRIFRVLVDAAQGGETNDQALAEKVPDLSPPIRGDVVVRPLFQGLDVRASAEDPNLGGVAVLPDEVELGDQSVPILPIRILIVLPLPPCLEKDRRLRREVALHTQLEEPAVGIAVPGDHRNVVADQVVVDLPEDRSLREDPVEERPRDGVVVPVELVELRVVLVVHHEPLVVDVERIAFAYRVVGPSVQRVLPAVHPLRLLRHREPCEFVRDEEAVGQPQPETEVEVDSCIGQCVVVHGVQVRVVRIAKDVRLIPESNGILARRELDHDAGDDMEDDVIDLIVRRQEDVVVVLDRKP